MEFRLFLNYDFEDYSLIYSITHFPMISPKLSDYNYNLPEERIAQHPLSERDAAKLLVYHKGGIAHSNFKKLPDFLPKNTLLVYNETQVVQARLHFTKSTGSRIEVFCLNPLQPFTEMSQAMQVRGETVWKCMVGNAKKWKADETLEMKLDDESILEATLICKDGRYAEVRFLWQPSEKTWAEILEIAGKIPLPPYINRSENASDSVEYQTVFAREKGAVAAPTAGLHFTENLLQELKKSGVEEARLTLHVGAGTFQPIEDEDVLAHPMHNEQIVFSKAFIQKLAQTERIIIPVGTTSMRALESLYWFGIQVIKLENVERFFVQKLEPYSYGEDVFPSRKESLKAVLNWMNEHGLEQLWGQTEIFIFPPYEFKICQGLITNFHLPQSTLLLLVSAMIGDDWKRIYIEAITNDYRFLSYGDGSLLLP
ncbi:MAG: S-adenosylmethionine:tRNA ribosyltransferase-isomerase [Bacteroidia bacterium]